MTTTLGVFAARCESDTLDNLVATALEHHHLSQQACETALHEAKLAGDALLQLKAQVKADGQNWGDWFKENCEDEGFSHRTASDYMRIAKNWGEIEMELADAKLISIRQALNILRTKESEARRTDEDDQDQVVVNPSNVTPDQEGDDPADEELMDAQLNTDAVVADDDNIRGDAEFSGVEVDETTPDAWGLTLVDREDIHVRFLATAEQVAEDFGISTARASKIGRRCLKRCQRGPHAAAEV